MTLFVINRVQNYAVSLGPCLDVAVFDSCRLIIQWTANCAPRAESAIYGSLDVKYASFESKRGGAGGVVGRVQAAVFADHVLDHQRRHVQWPQTAHRGRNLLSTRDGGYL